MDTHPSKSLTRLSWLFLFVVVSATALTSCNKKKKLVRIDPEFSKYIEAYTSGVVSKKSTIRLQLAADAVTTHAVNEPVKNELFSFSPSVKGTAYWVDARTIEFKPEKDLKPDELYEVSFQLGKVLHVPAKFRNFKFNIQITKPAFVVEENGLRSTGKDQLALSGQILTADVEENAKVEKLLKASLNGTAMKITWQHNEINKTHGYTVDNIKRGSSAGMLFISWSGEALNIRQSDQKELQVPAVGDFKVLDVKAIQDEEQYVLVQFSDPVKVGQALEGLITISNQEDISYTILGSEVKVYSSNRLDGNYTVQVNEGIENQWGEKLEKGFTSNLFFENRLPSVKIHGTGNILPNSGGRIVLPFDATNLKAVDVSVVKIFETNVAQFLQRNDLSGESELRRVAKPLVQATVRLDGDKTINLNRKNRFSLDLDKYIQTEPGAIYRVTIGFRPEYSLYTCAAVSETSPSEDDEEGEYYEYSDEDNTSGYGDDEDQQFWERYDRWYPYGYNWEQKDDPCSKAYFNKERFESRNIISSNIGLTAKKGTNNSLLVAASDIITTDALDGVELQVLDFQQQVVAKGTTNGDGIAMMDLKRKPYLIIAKKGEEKGYLKIDDGSSLSLSKFDVSGAEVRNGIKGFIFGERGVWRPGDSLFLGFIVEDKEKKLPADHPIEMELYSPRGQLYKKMVSTNSSDGFNVFRTATSPESPTGNWTCKMKIGGAVFQKTIKIETIMPNRLKINLDFGGLTALGKDAKVNGTLSAKWLFGATAQNLKARVDAQLYKKNTTFAKFEDYEFDNPTASFAPQSKTIFDGTLNAEGTASVSPAFEVNEQAPGMLLANLMVKVFEPGGNFSIDNISMPYHPYSSYVGVKVPQPTNTWGYLSTNKTHQFDIVDVNTEGVPTSGSLNVEVQVYKIQWRWWWDNSSNELSNFTQDSYNRLLKTQLVTLSNGRGAFSYKFDSDSWGRYLILVKDTRSGHVTGSVFFLDDDSWRSRRTDNEDPTSATMLSFTSDKPKYNVGEKVNLTIPSSEGGKAFISIETGSRVLKTWWVKTEKGQTKFSFPVDKEMSPNIYVNVSLIQPHAQTINDLPIRMYGLVPIIVEDKNTILKPVIKMPDVIRPEKQTSITVSEANGKSMSYVIAIVDEGLLDLTRFKTPDPHEAFYAKEALGVKSWDLYDYVIGAWGGELERILTIGGDGEGDLASKTRKANRFKPVVKFMGPFRSSGGSKTHNFTLPSYMGSVRAMVIAANSGAYGMAEKSVKVKSPLMILPTIPRVLGPAETVSIPVTVFATENNIRNVNISLEGNSLLQPVNKSITASFKGIGEQTILLSAVVKSNTGIGNIKVVASSGKEKAVYQTEIDVRNPNPLTTQVREFVLQPGQSISTDVAMIGDVQSSKATLELSSIPPINLQKRLSYLIQYPHGCIEQTTSSVFPQLVLDQLMKLDDRRKAEIDHNIKMGIQRIQNFQQNDGGFSYWPGYYSEGSDDWGSNYAGHFLLEASSKGYIVPANMLQQWRAYQRKKALAWNVTEAPWYGSDLTQAYRLYLLALAKAPEVGAMNRLKEFKFLSVEAKWRLAAAYNLAGQNQVALQLISGLPIDLPARIDPGFTYGSDMRDEAMILETLTLMGRRTEAYQVLKSVAARLSQDYWYSTQTTAYSLIAIAKFAGLNEDGNKINATASVNNQSTNINSTASVSQSNIAMPGGKGKVQLKNNGKSVLFARVINEGKPIQGQPIVATNNPSVLQVGVTYLNSSGQPIEVAQIKQGTDFVAKVAIHNPVSRVYTEMALSQIFPSGWEILNTRLYNNSEGAFQSSPSQYMDIRDDRVYHYFDIRAGETLTYYVQLNAAYLGKYYWPGVYAEAMYDHSISGGVAGKWVEVVQ